VTGIAPALAEIKELMSRNADQQLRAVTTPSIDQELFVHVYRCMRGTPLVRAVGATQMIGCLREEVGHKSDPPVRATIRAPKRKLSHVGGGLQTAAHS
jgi:hypothetical protein